MNDLRHAARLLLLAVLMIAVGCAAKKDGSGSSVSMPAPDGGTSGPDADPPPVIGALTLTPADATMVSDGSPITIDYRASLARPDGTTSDVTAEAVFSIDDFLMGTFDRARLTVRPAWGGKTTIRAKAAGAEGQTTLTIRGTRVVIGPGASPDAPKKFGGAVDAARAPQIVYPQTGTFVPPNMNVLELQFMPGAGNTLFELAFVSDALDLKVYFGCAPLGAGCAYTPDAPVWKLLADAGRARDALRYTLRGVDGAAPGGVGVSASQTIKFGEEDLLGGIYYWNAKEGATKRYEFGVTGKTAETYMNAGSAGATTCIGCHVLSRDGKRVAVGLDIPAPAPFKVFEVATRKELYRQGSMFGGGANFFSFSPDASQLAISNGASIGIRDGKTGAVVADKIVATGSMPDWSPDGKSIVYAHPAVAPPCFGDIFCGSPGVTDASLETIAFDGKSWGGVKPLVAFGAGGNNFYPAYSPDNGWVVFNRSPSNATSFDAKDAEVWLVAATGGAPMKLEKASPAAAAGGDSWPKWAPNVQKNRGGTLMWLTFSSRRAYGLRLAKGAQAQIWMTAVDPAEARKGVDPSAPAFWLPFQDLSSGNHIAQWVTRVERKPCVGKGDCDTGEECRDGVCRPVIR